MITCIVLEWPFIDFKSSFLSLMYRSLSLSHSGSLVYSLDHRLSLIFQSPESLNENRDKSRTSSGLEPTDFLSRGLMMMLLFFSRKCLFRHCDQSTRKSWRQFNKRLLSLLPQINGEDEDWAKKSPKAKGLMMIKWLHRLIVAELGHKNVMGYYFLLLRTWARCVLLVSCEIIALSCRA